MELKAISNNKVISNNKETILGLTKDQVIGEKEQFIQKQDLNLTSVYSDLNFLQIILAENDEDEMNQRNAYSAK